MRKWQSAGRGFMWFSRLYKYAEALERSLMCVGVFSVVSLYVEICVLSASQLDQILTWDNKPIIAAQ